MCPTNTLVWTVFFENFIVRWTWGGGSESSDPTQHAKGRTGDCPGPRKETTTRQNVTQNTGATPGGTRASTANKEEGHSKAGEATRTAGTGNQNGGDGRACAWEAATIKGGRPVDRGAWTAKIVKRPRQQPAHPQYANYWAPLPRKRHTMPHSAQPEHTNYWAPRTRKCHQQEHRPQWPTERSDPTQHAKGRTGDCPGPRKGATTRQNVTQGGGGGWHKALVVGCVSLWRRLLASRLLNLLL